MWSPCVQPSASAVTFVQPNAHGIQVSSHGFDFMYCKSHAATSNAQKSCCRTEKLRVRKPGLQSLGPDGERLKANSANNLKSVQQSFNGRCRSIGSIYRSHAKEASEDKCFTTFVVVGVRKCTLGGLASAGFWLQSGESKTECPERTCLQPALTSLKPGCGGVL